LKGGKPKAKGAKKGAQGLQERVLAAIAAQRAGRLDEAEKAYLAVLEAEPVNVDALHYLGVLRHQQGRTPR